ncbi:MAG: response regulator [Bacteroidales bacterium]|nr:response regulator [Bacteroidales bacterium]MCF8403673.1 response regulator [Bacteroidales bacterium]
MKKWLLSYKVSTRHRMMIGIAIFSLTALGLAAHYFYQTSRVMSIIINAERIHNIKYHRSIESYYEFLHTNDTLVLRNGLAELDTANQLAYIFSRSAQIIKSYSDNALADSLYCAAPESFNYKKTNAHLLVSRVKLLLAIENKPAIKCLEIAGEGAAIGKQVHAIISKSLQNSSTEQIHQLELTNEIMAGFFTSFASNVYEVIDFARRLLIWGIVLTVLILGSLTIILTTYISKTISRPVLKVMEQVKAMAKGDISNKITILNKDEIGQLAEAANEMIDNLDIITRQADIIATGDYSQELEPRSEKDSLGISIQKMTQSLRQMSAENKKENWLKSGLNELNDKMRGDLEIQPLANGVINFLCKYLSVEMGIIYFLQPEDHSFKQMASYAFSTRKKLTNIVKPGEGLVGQAIAEKDYITLTEVPDDYFPISSGLGNTIPKTITVIPIVYQQEVVGAIELASLNNFSVDELNFIKSVVENVGIAYNAARSRNEIQLLLSKTQQQAIELQGQQEELKQSNEVLEKQAQALKESESSLQAQQEELRQTNEELQEQAKALKASEENLQTQQEELRVINEELEERTQDLEKQRDDTRKKNIELEKAKQETQQKARDLELASKYKSEFLANMSHELRTPLNSILVLSQMLSSNKNNNLTDKQIEFASTINSSGKDLLELINDVLDLSKVESGMMELNIEQVKLSQLVEDINKNFGQIAIDKGLEFEVDLDQNLQENIQTDSMRLMQIIKNFTANAIKYTEEGSVKIKLGTPDEKLDLSNSGLKHKEAICISVSDTGIGINKEKQELIFEAFRQADGTTSRKYGGTGLGLSISKNLAQLLGGEIQLFSKNGSGSTFSLIIPQNKTAKEQDKVKTESNKPVVKIPVNGDSVDSMDKEISTAAQDDNVRDDRKNISKDDKIILIIEDDPNFAQILYDLAHEKDYKCLLAKNGETGLHYADFYKPDAIVLDIGLPGIDGWEVMERLKENPETRHIPVHFMSASDKNIEALKMGAIGYLSKPASVESINEAFNKIETSISKSVRNLLIVEDDDVMRKSIADLIDEENIYIVGVETGKEGINHLKSGDFDCMILDLGLKDISGFDLLEKIRKDNSIPRIPIIIYTGKELNRDEEAKLQKYANSIIIKGAHSPERLISETTLFLHQVESKLPKEKQKVLKMMHDKESTLSGKKIMIVDDDMRNVFALSSVLEEANLKVIVGRNGKEGLDQLNQHPDINLVLMDIMMPEMDGYDAMKEIRKQSRYKKLPIIALTAKAMKGDREKCIESGANDYLTKPVDTDKLLSLLRVWMYN